MTDFDKPIVIKRISPDDRKFTLLIDADTNEPWGCRIIQTMSMDEFKRKYPRYD